MANWVAPTRIDAVNSAGSLRAALSDWRSVGRFHVGTGHIEPTIDAGYLGPPLWGIRLHALSNGQTYRSVSLLFGGVHIRRVSQRRYSRTAHSVPSNARNSATGPCAETMQRSLKPERQETNRPLPLKRNPLMFGAAFRRDVMQLVFLETHESVAHPSLDIRERTGLALRRLGQMIHPLP